MFVADASEMRPYLVRPYLVTSLPGHVPTWTVPAGAVPAWGKHGVE